MQGIGRVSDTVYDRSVSKVLHKKPSLDGYKVSAGRDSGSASAAAMKLVTASAQGSCEVSDAGACKVALAINRLMAAGSRPVSIAIQVVMPEEAEEAVLRNVLKSADEAVKEAGLAVCQSDAISVKGIEYPVITVTATGLAASLFEPEKAKADQDIIMTGYAGWSGSIHLAETYKERLIQHFNQTFLSEVETSSQLANEAAYEAAKAGVRTMYATGEGGVFAAIWEMAKGANLGVRVNLKEIPLRQETVEICDHLGITPYQLMTEGSLLLAVTHGQKVLGQLAAAGIPAVIIGHLTDDNDRVVINEDETRYLEPFRGDSLSGI